MIHRAIYCVWHNNVHTQYILCVGVCVRSVHEYFAMNTFQYIERERGEGAIDMTTLLLVSLVQFIFYFIFGGGGDVFMCFLLLFLLFILYFIEPPLNKFESPSFIYFSRDDNNLFESWPAVYLTLYARIDCSMCVCVCRLLCCIVPCRVVPCRAMSSM